MELQHFSAGNSTFILRKLRHSDKENVIDLLSDPDVMKYIGPRRPMTTGEIDNWMNRNIQKYETGWNRWAIAFAENDELIGMAGIQPINNKFDFGYYFRRNVWGKGVARKCLELVLRELPLADITMETFIASENIRSIKLAKTLGFIGLGRFEKDGEIGEYYTLSNKGANDTPEATSD